MTSPEPLAARPAQPALVPDVGGDDGVTITISEVLSRLKGDFPDLTISKIRFYEGEGLLNPRRSASGYRKFSEADVARLRFILTAVRDHYLPLKVVRARLDALDAEGLAAPPPPAPAAARRPGSEAPDVGQGLGPDPGPEAFGPDPTEVRLTRHELVRASGLSDQQLGELEQYGLVAARVGSSWYDGDALLVARIVAELSGYGIGARHLRPAKAAADREVGLIEQVVSPLVRQRGGPVRARADEVARDLAALSVRLHAALVRSGLRRAGR